MMMAIIIIINPLIIIIIIIIIIINPESVKENETHKFLWDFEIHTEHQISATRPDHIIINKEKKKKEKKKRTCRFGNFAVPAYH